MFVIEGNGEGFYIGKQYICAGEKYAVFSRLNDLAKKYKSQKIAEKVKNKLLERCCNVAECSLNDCFINIRVKEIQDENTL